MAFGIEVSLAAAFLVPKTTAGQTRRPV